MKWKIKTNNFFYYKNKNQVKISNKTANGKNLTEATVINVAEKKTEKISIS